MYKITRLKRPTILQLLKMTKNLSQKFKNKKYCDVEAHCKSHTNSLPIVEYGIYVEDTCQYMNLTVDELYKNYLGLMGG